MCAILGKPKRNVAFAPRLIKKAQPNILTSAEKNEYLDFVVQESVAQFKDSTRMIKPKTSQSLLI
jgi:4-aminobutyrate aminotransferase-like enzyme